MLREEMVKVDGATLRCCAEGADGDAQWVVFGNSLMTDCSIWDAQAAALANEFRLLRYDARGHGGSSVAEAGFGVETLGVDLLAVLDHFGIKRCTYVGLSIGVPTGLAAHGMTPQRFERLVFVDGQARTAPTGAASWEERIGFARTQGMHRMGEETMRRWLGPGAAAGDRGRGLAAMIAATPLEGFVAGARALQNYDFSTEVARLRCPLLAIAGACDGAMPDGMAKVFGGVPGAEIVQIEDAGHVPNYERPEAFNAVLLPFLRASA